MNETDSGQQPQDVADIRRELNDQLERLCREMASRSGLTDRASKDATASEVLGRVEDAGGTYVLLRVPTVLGQVLSPRESEVAILAGEGLPNKIIADQLSISESTVAAHLRGIFQKLRVHSRTELAHLALLLK